MDAADCSERSPASGCPIEGYAVKQRVCDNFFVATGAGGDVLLKVIPCRGVDDATTVQRHIESYTHLESEKVTRVICGFVRHSDEGGHEACAVMEFVSGRTLRDYVGAGLHLDTTVDTVAQVAEGVAWLHARGIVHGALCPNNVMITMDGGRRTAKLTNVGFASDAVAYQDGVVDWLPYASPERMLAVAAATAARSSAAAAASPADSATVGGDLWSLGVMLYEMHTGDHAFTREPSGFAKIFRANPSVISGIIDVDIASLLSQLLVVSPDGRLDVDTLLALLKPVHARTRMRLLADLDSLECNPAHVREQATVERVVAAAAARIDNVEVQRAAVAALGRLAAARSDLPHLQRAETGIDSSSGPSCRGDFEFQRAAAWAGRSLSAEVSKDPHELTAGSSCIVPASQRPAGAAEYSQAPEGGIECVVAAANAHRSDAEVQRATAWALYAMACHYDCNRGRIRECLGVECVVAGATAHLANVEVQQGAANALRKIVIADLNDSYVCEHGGIDYVITAAETHCDDVEVQRAALWVLCDAACRHDSNRILIRARGGVECTVAASTRHLADVEVQRAAASALRKLAMAGENKLYIREHESTVAAAVFHRRDLEVQRAAARTFANLAVGELNRVYMREQGVVECIVEGAAAHTGDVELQRAAANALTILCLEEANRVFVCEHGGADCVITAAKAYPRDFEMQMVMAGAVGMMATEESNQLYVCERGAVECIVAAASAHGNDVKLRRVTTWALRNIVWSHDSNRKHVREQHGIDCIVAAAMDYADDLEVQRAVVGAFARLFLDSRNLIDICKAAVPCLVIGATRFVDVELHRYFTLAAQQLSVADAEVREAFRDLRGLSSVLDCARANINNALVLAPALHALACFCQEGAAAEQILEKEGLPFLMNALREFERAKEMQMLIVGTLCQISCHDSTRTRSLECGVATVLDQFVTNEEQYPEDLRLAVARARDFLQLGSFAQAQTPAATQQDVGASPHQSRVFTVQADAPLLSVKKIAMKEVTIEPDGFLGRGGFAEVRRGCYRKQAVALKSYFVLNPALKNFITALGRDRLRRMFQNECKISSLVPKHRNIVRFVGLVVDEPSQDHLYMAYELMERTFHSALCGGLGLRAAIGVLCDVACGLNHLHEMNFVHLDIKPANILLAPQDGDLVAKIADFGLAQQVNEVSQVSGTPSYMAPEMRSRGARVTTAMDSFSFGVTAMEAALRQAPAPVPLCERGPATSECERRAKHLLELSTVNKPLVALVRKCLAEQPTERATAREALTLLNTMRNM